eukprot:1738467-Rhodomonas_salina.3
MPRLQSLRAAHQQPPPSSSSQTPSVRCSNQPQASDDQPALPRAAHQQPPRSSVQRLVERGPYTLSGGGGFVGLVEGMRAREK